MRYDGIDYIHDDDGNLVEVENPNVDEQVREFNVITTRRRDGYVTSLLFALFILIGL